MKLTEIFVRKSVVLNLEPGEKRAVIKELVEALKEGHSLTLKVAEAVEAIMRREQMGSTGLGRGVAIPHTRLESLDRVVGVIGRCPKGTAYNSIDGEPVHFIFLMLSPSADPQKGIDALQRVNSAIKIDNFCRFLHQARTAKEVRDLFEEADERLDGRS